MIVPGITQSVIKLVLIAADIVAKDSHATLCIDRFRHPVHDVIFVGIGKVQIISIFYDIICHIISQFPLKPQRRLDACKLMSGPRRHRHRPCYYRWHPSQGLAACAVVGVLRHAAHRVGGFHQTVVPILNESVDKGLIIRDADNIAVEFISYVKRTYFIAIPIISNKMCKFIFKWVLYIFCCVIPYE